MTDSKKEPGAAVPGRNDDAVDTPSLRIFKYLSGQLDEDGADLAGAIDDVLGDDGASLRGLRRALGSDEPDEDAEADDEFADEFAEYLTRGDEAATLLPEVHARVQSQPQLQKLAAGLRPDIEAWGRSWQGLADRLREAGSVPSDVKLVWGSGGMLSGVLAVALDQIGKVVASGMDQFFGRMQARLGMQPMGAEALSSPTTDPADREACWRIPVADRNYEIVLWIRPRRQADGWDLRCELNSPFDKELESKTQIAVRRQSGQLVCELPLAQQRAAPFYLPFGELQVKLSVDGDERVIPLRLPGEPPPRPGDAAGARGAVMGAAAAPREAAIGQRPGAAGRAVATTVKLSVQQGQNEARRRILVYKPETAGDFAPPIGKSRPFDRRQLQALVKELRKAVECLVQFAWAGVRRQGFDIAEQADNLSRAVLPDEGSFSTVLQMGLHPHFEIVYNAAAMIPWEALRDRYYVCRNPEHATLYLTQHHPDGHALACPTCRQPMAAEKSWLVLDRRLTHEAYGGKPRRSVGRRFLMILDPTEDLCNPKVDPHGECDRHGPELRAQLKQAGYDTLTLRGSAASRAQVKSLLADPQVIGLYYFGHGCFPDDAAEGHLILAGQERLYASEIERDINPGIQFVFLNACQGGDGGSKWDVKRPTKSVGYAFAEGDLTKVAIAPIWPVLNVQAARSALTFFRHALAGESLAEALHQVRVESYARYQQDEPDISWLAYRYFGPAHRVLPVPERAVAVPAPGGTLVVVKDLGNRVFAADGSFRLDAFGFDAREVFLRAAKRRNFQQRSRLTVIDLLAGLIRKGDLTRLALRELGIKDPDQLYGILGQEIEPGESDEPAPPAWDRIGLHDRFAAVLDPVAWLTKLLARFTVQDRSEFRNDLAALLERADRLSQQNARGGAQPISERDVLEALTADDGWRTATRAPLPAPAAVGAWLRQGDYSRTVDDNGQLALDRLDAGARNVIKEAHTQAQQRGALRAGKPDIPQRLVCAAFLADHQEDVGRLLKIQEIEREELGDLLVQTVDEGLPESFGLSAEAGQRVVVPMTAAALRLALPNQPVTQLHLFQAFCQVATSDFKDLLRAFPAPLRMDLDAFFQNTFR